MVPKIDVPFSERAKRLFARLPITQRAIRVVTDAIYEFMVAVAVVRHRTFRGRPNISAADLAKMYRFVTIRDKDLRRRLTPDYDFGCKRPTFSNSYYRTFTKPNVHLQDSGIDHGSSRTASSPTTAPRPSSTPWCWQPVSTCGRRTSRPSR